MDQSRRWKKFVHDVGIYGVGNVGAKVITFLMVPLYTHFIPDTAAFGYFDICLTAAFLLSPLITLDLRDGLFRYLLDADSDRARSTIITASCRVLARTLALSLAIMLAVAFFVSIEHSWLTLALLLSVAVLEVYGQTVRGLGRNHVFVGMGLATALLIALLSIVFVAWMDMGIAGVFIANIAARVLPIAVVELRLRLVSRHFDAGVAWKPQARELLRFSLPLLPAIVIWWVLSFGDRWFVLWAAGAEANGIYAVAARFTGAIYTFTVIVQQAWQETAILQFRSADRDRFFSQIFTLFIYAVCGVVIVYVVVLKFNYGWLVEAHYASSLQYIFPMAIAAGIFSLANFLEMGYQCARETRRALPASIATGMVNVVFNLLLAPLWGTWGVVTASLVSFTFFAIYRYADTRRYFTLTPSWRTLVPVAMVALVGACLYTTMAWWCFAVVACISLAAIVLSLPQSWRTLLRHSTSGSGPGSSGSPIE